MQRASALVKNLPKSFAALRQETAAKGGDPLPLTVIADGKQTKVYFPAELPDDDKILLSVGTLIELCTLAGFDVVASKRENIASFTSLMEATSDNIKGAFYCLERNEITPVANIPTTLKRGWEFALWYSFAEAAKEDIASDYLSIRRETSLVSTTGAAWNPNRQFPDLSRLSALIRLVAKKLSYKVVAPKKFLKGEGYFLEKFVGKKPMPGLLTTAEFALVHKHWESKQKSVKDRYKAIPDKFQDLPMKGLGAYIAGFNIANPANISNIEATKISRVPMLLTTVGRGRSAVQAIAKGGNLPAKLRAIDGGDSVRTIGRVLYSPLNGMSQNEFISLSIRLATQLQKGSKGNASAISTDFFTHFSEMDEDNAALMKSDWASVELAAQTYLEVLPDKLGIPAWDATFASAG
jgi:hypothetical protein